MSTTTAYKLSKKQKARRKAHQERQAQWHAKVDEIIVALDADPYLSVNRAAEKFKFSRFVLIRILKKRGLERYLGRSKARDDWMPLLKVVIADMEADDRLTVPEAAKKHGMIDSTLRTHLKKLGYAKFLGRTTQVRIPWDEYVPQIVSIMRADKSLTIPQMAEKYGVPKRNLQGEIKKCGYHDLIGRGRAARFDWDELWPKMLAELESDENLSLPKIGKKYGVGHRAMLQQARKQNRHDLIGRGRISPFSYEWSELLPKIVADLEADTNLTVPQVSERYGMHSKTVTLKLKESGNTRFLGRGAGAKSTLDDETWERIVAMVEAGKSIYDMSEALGRPYSTLVYNLKRRGLYEKARVLRRVDISVYDKAVEMLNEDPLLSIAACARLLGLNPTPLGSFLKSVGLRKRFAKRYKKTKQHGSYAANKRHVRAVTKAIVLQVGDIYRDVRYQTLFLAVDDKKLLGMKDGKLYERKPIMSIAHDVDRTVKDLAEQWGKTVAEVETIAYTYLQRVSAPKNVSDRTIRANNKFEPHEYRIRTA